MKRKMLQTEHVRKTQVCLNQDIPIMIKKDNANKYITVTMN